jgi:hypothetical protein
VHRSSDPHMHINLQPSVTSLITHLPPRHPKSLAEPSGGLRRQLSRPTGPPNPRGKTHTLCPGPLNPRGKMHMLCPISPNPHNKTHTLCPGPPNPRGTSPANQPRPLKTRGRSSKSSSPSHLVSNLFGFPPKTLIMSPTWLHLKRQNLRKLKFSQRKSLFV